MSSKSPSEQIIDVVTSWPGITAAQGSRGELSFRLGRREIGHLHGDAAAHFNFPRHVWVALYKQGRIEPHPIFGLIQRHAKVDDSEMFEVFNMGIGFCYVVDPADAEATLAILKKYGRTAQRIGHAVADAQKIVHIPQRQLAGQHKRFWNEERAARRAG